MIAVRELIANALVHRDLSQHTSGKDVQLILDNDRLIIASPGGLWGLTTSQLGVSNVKSAVNQFLYEICQLTRTETGQRVVEGEGGGLHEVRRALRRTGMREPEFHDNGVKFTVVLPRHGLLRDEDLAWLAMLPNQDELNDIQRQILVSMRHGGTWTNQQVRDEFGPLDSRDARTYLQGLVYEGLAVARGQGRGTEYVLAGNLGGEPPESASGIALSTVNIRTAAEGVAGIGVGRHGPQLMDALRAGAATRRDIQASTGLSATQVRYGLQLLLDSGHVVRNGGRGNRDTRYRVAP